MSNSPKIRKRLPCLAKVARPDIRFAVQAAFTSQKQKIYLVDPESLEYIDGLVNAPAIFLTFTPPPNPEIASKKTFGFIPPQPSKEKKSKPEEIRVDATLYFSYPNDDFFTGVDEDTGVTVIVIQVWHDAELQKWQKIAQKVAVSLMAKKRNNRIPTVFFYITSHFVPNDPNAPRQLILKPDNHDESCNAVSHLHLAPDDFEDE